MVSKKQIVIVCVITVCVIGLFAVVLNKNKSSDRQSSQTETTTTQTGTNFWDNVDVVEDGDAVTKSGNQEVNADTDNETAINSKKDDDKSDDANEEKTEDGASASDDEWSPIVPADQVGE